MIRIHASEWFEVKTKVKKTMEDGSEKAVIEAIVVDALSWAETEKRTAEEYDGFDFEITDIRKAKFKEIFFSDSKANTKFYKSKVTSITLDEKSDKEKKSFLYYLVEAQDLEHAKTNIDEVMRDTMNDYEVISVVETNLVQVLEHEPTQKLL